jgi:hypothetical protein
MEENKTDRHSNDKITGRLVDEIVKCAGGDPNNMDVEDVIEDWTYAVNEQKRVLFTTNQLDPRYTDPGMLKEDLL